MRQIQHLSALMVFAVSILAAGMAGADDGLSLSGTFTATSGIGLDENDQGRAAYDAELRLILENAARGALGFRVEGGFRWAYGLLSPLSILLESGLALPPPEESLLPGTDLHREFYLDQAYAKARMGNLELRAGLFPLAWGAAYFYNPTARTGTPVLPGENLEDRSGKPGMALSLALPFGLSLEGYALAQGRHATGIPDIDELVLADVPWGSRLQLRTDCLDVSASIMKVLPKEGALAGSWLGFDMALTMGILSFYSELVSNLDEMEASIGFWWPVPDHAVDLRGEYIWLQGGGVDPADYEVAALLSGTASLLGQSYMFLGIEKEDPQAASWKLSLGTLVNLNDLSAGLLAEFAWMPVQDFALSVFARVFTGGGNDEFGGSLSPAPGLSIIPYRSIGGLMVTWNF